MSRPERGHRAAPSRGRWWRRLAVLGVMLVVAFGFGRSLLPVFGVGTHKTGQAAQPTASPPAMADVGGVRVPGTGQPLLMLNPGLVRPGTVVQVLGSGFDAGSTVDIQVGGGGPAGTVRADKGGYLTASLPFPARVGGGRAEVVAKQRGSTKTARAVAVVAQGVGTATLSAIVGRPGDTVALTARGFSPNETLAVYWGRTTGEPDATLHADETGAVSRAPLRVGVAPVGVASVFVVGRTSGIAAGVPFQILSLYPSIAVKPYALKAQQPVSFSGKGFAPDERVLVYLNAVGGQPLMAVQASDSGTFSGAGLTVPYALTGQQSLLFIGEQSRATAKTGFTVLPYLPSGRPSVYGGLPGTSLSFYAQGFAPNEAVHVYAGRTKGSAGTLVAAFRVDASGRAAAAGSYTIPGDAPDSLTFGMVGMRSNATATATIKVDHSGGPVNLPAAPPYQLPKDLER
ncbi:MAG TPA: hypothetical protein VJT31_36545 [Rugosimonospora sp.]|nr:hypothetical protein [Rugosimonospora sp.]